MNRTAWILTGLFVVLVVTVIFLVGRNDETDSSTTTTLRRHDDDDPGRQHVHDLRCHHTTTSTSVATTTTLAPTTTTTAPTTTTSVAVAGNWAATPMVAAGFGALGWWDGASWVQVDPGTALPVAGGEDYQVALIGLEAIVAAGAPTTLCEPLNNPGVVFENEQVLGDWPGPCRSGDHGAVVDRAASGRTDRG